MDWALLFASVCAAALHWGEGRSLVSGWSLCLSLSLVSSQHQSTEAQGSIINPLVWSPVLPQLCLLPGCVPVLSCSSSCSSPCALGARCSSTGRATALRWGCLLPPRLCWGCRARTHQQGEQKAGVHSCHAWPRRMQTPALCVSSLRTGVKNSSQIAHMF